MILKQSFSNLSVHETHLFFFPRFIYFWLCKVFVAAGGLSPGTASGGSSLVAVPGFLIAMASLVAVRSFIRYSTWAQ